MSKSMLVNVTAEEEHRVAVVDNGVLDLFEIETLSRENIKGNIFKGSVEGVNPALEAAFVNYGGERPGFLPVDEVNFKLYPSRDGGSGGKGRGARVTRHLEKGMEILVQVIRDSFANKPPTLSTYYSLPGRYLVLMPGADAAGISRKIEDEEQRNRLRKILDDLAVPDGYGVIVRTAGTEISSEELQADLEALLELWRTIERASDHAKAPALIYQERDLVLRTTRDYFTSDIEEVLIDDERTYQRVKKFFEVHMPDRAGLVRLYTGEKPIFSKHNLEDQIERIFKRVVQLKGGGAISIDHTEALTAIDVNSARSARSSSSEDTALHTNLEAAEEIARQLRLRDIGGLVVIDFIDMESSRHARKVERAFAAAMGRDKARYDATRISKLGLMEVSRQRIKSAKRSSSFTNCPTCAGDGVIRTPEAAARAAFRKIQARVVRGEFAGVKVYLPTDVALYLLNEKRDDLYRLEGRHKVRIEIIFQEQMRPDQFEIEEIRREEDEVAPMVTAETVDEALAEGARPQAAKAAKGAKREGASGTKVKKRRRRRRISEPEAASSRQPSPASLDLAVSAGATCDEPPVFSEGPESDDAAAELLAAAADGPAATIDASEAKDLPSEARRTPRRRRRRRRRPRSVGADRGESLAAAPQGDSAWPAAPEFPHPSAPDSPGNESPDQPGMTPPVAVVPGDSRPLKLVDISAPPQGDARGASDRPKDDSAAVQGETSPAEQPKRKRSWWRRAFRG